MLVITAAQLYVVINSLAEEHKAKRWYQPHHKMRLTIMINTLLGIAEWIEAGAGQGNCGCATHTNERSN